MVASSGKPSKNFSVPSGVSIESGVVISGGMSVAIFGLAVWAAAQVIKIAAKVSAAAARLRAFRFACFMIVGGRQFVPDMGQTAKEDHTRRSGSILAVEFCNDLSNRIRLGNSAGSNNRQPQKR